jgi:hypothetical protein
MVHIVRRSSSQRLRQLHPPHVATAGAGATGEDAGGEAKSGGGGGGAADWACAESMVGGTD